MFRNSFQIFLSCIIFFMCLAANAGGFTKWKGTGNESDWFNPEFWTDGVPRDDDTVIIEGPGVSVPCLDSRKAAVGNLFISGGAGLKMRGNAALTVTDILAVGSKDGEVADTPGGSFLNAEGNGTLAIGNILSVFKSGKKASSLTLHGAAPDKQFTLCNNDSNGFSASFDGVLDFKNCNVTGISHIGFFQPVSNYPDGRDSMTMGGSIGIPEEMHSAGVNIASHINFPNNDFMKTIQSYHRHQIKVLPYVSFVKLVDLSLEDGGVNASYGTNSGRILWKFHPFWKELDYSAHPEWRNVDENGDYSRPFSSKSYPDGIAMSCLRSEGIAEAYLRGVDNLLKTGADGFYLDNTVEGCRNRPCDGPRFNRHKHFNEEWDRGTAFKAMVLGICSEIKKKYPDCILTGGHNQFWENAQDIGLETEGFICQINRPRYQNWSEIMEIITNKNTQNMMEKGHRYILLSYLGGPAACLRDDAFYCFASAALGRFAWSGFGFPMASRILNRTKLGPAESDIEKINTVYCRYFKNGIVFVNPSDKTETIKFHSNKSLGELADVYTGNCLTSEENGLKMELPPASGRICIPRINLLVNYLLELECLASQCMRKQNKKTPLYKELYAFNDAVARMLIDIKSKNNPDAQIKYLGTCSSTLLDYNMKLANIASASSVPEESYPSEMFFLQSYLSKLCMNINRIKIQYTFSGNARAGKDLTLNIQAASSLRPASFNVKLICPENITAVPDGQKMICSKNGDAQTAFTLEIGKDECFAKRALIKLYVQARPEGTDEPLQFSELIEVPISTGSINKSITTGIYDEVSIGLDFEPAGMANKNFPITVNINSIGISSADNDYLEDLNLLIRRKNKSTGPMEIRIPIFKGCRIGGSAALQESAENNVIRISQEKPASSAVEWKPEIPGKYYLGISYKYTDPDHPEKANKTQAVYYFKENLIDISPELFQEGNIKQ